MAAMKKVRSKAATRVSRAKTTASGQAVIASLREICAWQRGKVALQVTELPDPMLPPRIKAMR